MRPDSELQIEPPTLRYPVLPRDLTRYVMLGSLRMLADRSPTNLTIVYVFKSSIELLTVS